MTSRLRTQGIQQGGACTTQANQQARDLDAAVIDECLRLANLTFGQSQDLLRAYRRSWRSLCASIQSPQPHVPLLRGGR